MKTDTFLDSFVPRRKSKRKERTVTIDENIKSADKDTAPIDSVVGEKLSIIYVLKKGFHEITYYVSTQLQQNTVSAKNIGTEIENTLDAVAQLNARTSDEQEDGFTSSVLISPKLNF
jgi:hypothetical protein